MTKTSSRTTWGAAPHRISWRERRLAMCLCVMLLSLLTWTTAAHAQTETTEYYAYDAIGSVRAVFNTAGAVVGRGDFMPFGEGITETGLPSERFTGQPRDPEAGLDYFEARSYQVRHGRFSRVDPLFGQAVGQPQRWNRYAYALNNPLSYVDRSGLEAGSSGPPHFTTGVQVPDPGGDAMTFWISIFFGEGNGCLFCAVVGTGTDTGGPVAFPGGFPGYGGTGVGSGDDGAGDATDSGGDDGQVPMLLPEGYIGNPELDAFGLVNPLSIGVSIGAKVPSILSRLLSRFFGTGSPAIKSFEIHQRVVGQLMDERLGPLAGRLGPADLQRLVNSPGAARLWDNATGNINVIQSLDGVLLRITTPSDAFRIISVGPIRPNGVANGILSGRFIPMP